MKLPQPPYLVGVYPSQLAWTRNDINDVYVSSHSGYAPSWKSSKPDQQPIARQTSEQKSKKTGFKLMVARLGYKSKLTVLPSFPETNPTASRGNNTVP